MLWTIPSGLRGCIECCVGAMETDYAHDDETIGQNNTIKSSETDQMATGSITYVQCSSRDSTDSTSSQNGLYLIRIMRPLKFIYNSSMCVDGHPTFVENDYCLCVWDVATVSCIVSQTRHFLLIIFMNINELVSSYFIIYSSHIYFTSGLSCWWVDWIVGQIWTSIRSTMILPSSTARLNRIKKVKKTWYHVVVHLFASHRTNKIIVSTFIKTISDICDISSH